MKQEIRRLSDSELEVMQAVWNCKAPATRKDIEQTLSREAPMAATTLLTLLTRFSEKGFVRIDKVGRGSVYTPLVEQHEYLSAQSGRFIRRLCGGSMTTFVSALCDSGLSRTEGLGFYQLLLYRSAGADGVCWRLPGL